MPSAATTAFEYPADICTSVGDHIKLDIGANAILTVMADVNDVLYFILRQTIRADSTEKASILSVSFPKGKPLPASYYAQKWEYFGRGNILVVHNDYKTVSFEVGVSKSDKLIVQNMDLVTYELLKTELLRTPEKVLEGLAEELKNANLKSAFREIYTNSEVSDFSILCKDGESVEVHGAVLSTFWPFFKGLMTNECIEKTERTLRLDFPSEWVKLMVAHIYKQPLKLSFDEATGMVLLSDMYLLPELGDIAAEQIKTLVDEKTCLEDLLLGWDRSREASHEELRQLFAKGIAQKNPMAQMDLFRGLEEGKLLELYFDTSKVVGI